MSDEKKSGMTRRDFAKASAAGVAGFAILNSGSRAYAANERYRYGLLGCGGRGTGAATQHMLGNDNVEMVAMADIFQDRLDSSRGRIGDNKDERVANQFKVKDDMCFVGPDAYKRFLDTDIDLIIEGTLPYSRPKHVEAAVEAGKHVFTEKPAAVDPTGIRRFIAAAEKAKEKNLCLVAGTQRRHQLNYQETIKKLHDGAIGDIKSMRVYWCGSLPFVKERAPDWSELEYRIRNWYAYCWTCGDNIVEQHVHNLDVACWTLQAHPVSVFASGGRAWKPFEDMYGNLWDHFSCDFEFPNNVHVTSMCRHWGKADGGVFEEAFGTNGSSKCNDMMDSPAENMIDPYIQEHTDLGNAVRGNDPYINEGVQVAHSTMTAIMGRMSAYTGKALTWDEAINSDLHITPPDELDFTQPFPVAPIPRPGV